MNPMTSLSALSANMGAFGIIATILAIIATVAAFILVVPESKREKLGRFGKFLHDAVNFKFLIVEKILQALYIFVTAYLILCGFFMLFMAPETWTGRHWLGGYGILLMVLGPIAVRLCYELLMMAVLLLKNVISINNKLRNQNEGKAQDGIFAVPDMSDLRQQLRSKAVRPQSPQNPSAPNFCSKCGSPLNEDGKCPNCGNGQDEA